MLLVACRLLLVDLLCGGSCLLVAVCPGLRVACCLLCVMCCALFIVGGWLLLHVDVCSCVTLSVVVCCLLFVDCCLLVGACCMLPGDCLLLFID